VLTPLVSTAQLEDHAIHLAFLAFVAIFAVILTVAAIADARANRRSTR
jgi:hypothetical protein